VLMLQLHFIFSLSKLSLSDGYNKIQTERIEIYTPECVPTLQKKRKLVSSCTFVNF